MELREFVKRSLSDIINGVNEAKKETDIAVAPGMFEGTIITDPQMINFEVAVTSEKDGGGKVSVWSAIEAKGQVSSQNINKISFSVPIYLQAKSSQI